ncbi:MAG: glycoside hydrolase family 25 domain-containing protein [Acidimicrobiales bacterium]
MRRRHDPHFGPPAPARRLSRSLARAAATLGLLLGAFGLVVVAPSVTSPSARLPTAAAASATPAYWLVASDGGVFAFGGAGFFGSAGNLPLRKPVVGMAATADSQGYWLVASDGGIFTYGDANFYGSMGGQPLNEPVVGMAATPDGHGYWEVASDGGIFAFGDANFYGSMGGRPLNQPIVGIAATADGGGYWEVASDGGIFAFGDANFYGSMGGQPLNQPIIGMTPSPNGTGYMMVASDGGLFAFGDTQFHGSLGGVPLTRPIAAMALTPTGDGYWMSDNNGAVTAFGNARYWGSAPQVLNKPIVGMAEGAGTGQFSSISFQSGSYGYDVSNYQCNQTLPSGHSLGIVEVEGGSYAPVNPCLTQEAAWAGAGLNLYLYLTYGTSSASGAPGFCNGDQACAYGFAAAQYAYSQAVASGIDAQVAWWIDVENDPSWSSSQSENAQLVMGAIEGIRAEGINSVGIYASPGTWSGIVGSYSPAVPYWMAWYSLQSGPYDCQNAGTWTNNPANHLPTGPVVIVQYSSPQYPVPNDSLDPTMDHDYAC